MSDSIEKKEINDLNKINKPTEQDNPTKIFNIAEIGNNCLLIDVVRFYYNQGFNVIPAIRKASEPKKYPLAKFEQWHQTRQTWGNVLEYFGKYQDQTIKNSIDIALINGKFSNNIIVLDFDEADAYFEYEKLIPKYLIATWIVESQKGYHVYYQLPEDLEVKRQTPSKHPIDILGTGGFVYAVPSLHKLQEIEYSFVSPVNNIQKINPEDWLVIKKIVEQSTGYIIVDNIKSPQKTPKQIKASTSMTKDTIESHQKEQEKATVTEKTIATKPNQKPSGIIERLTKDLDSETITKIARLIEPYYQKHSRQEFIFILAGYLRRWPLSLFSIKQIVTLLQSNDPTTEMIDKEQRLAAVEQQYNRSLALLVKGKGELEKIFDKSHLKFLQKLLVQSLYFVKVFFRMQQWVHNEPREGQVTITHTKVQKDDSGETEEIEVKNPVIQAALWNTKMFIDPVDTQEFYHTEWVTQINKNSQILKFNGSLDEIRELIKERGLITNKNSFQDVFNTLINGFKRQGLMPVEQRVRSPGFFHLNDGTIISDDVIPIPTPAELNSSLEALETILDVYDWHPVVISIIKWSLLAPFNFIRKQNKHKTDSMPHIDLYGEKNTGKSTIGNLAAAINGIPITEEYEKGADAADTPYRIGKIMDQWTYPVQVNEMKSEVLSNRNKSNLLGILKSAFDGLYSREVMDSKTRMHKKYRALALMIWTSNTNLLTGQSGQMQRRFYVMCYDSLPNTDKQIEKFFDETRPLFNKLKFFGHYIRNIITVDQILERQWKNTTNLLIQECYDYAKRDWDTKKENWKQWTDDQKNPLEEDPHKILLYIIDYINSTARMYAPDILGEIFVSEKLQKLMERRLIKYIYCIANRKTHEQDVIITSDFITEHLNKTKYLEMPPLKALSRYLKKTNDKWEYKTVKITSLGILKTCIRGPAQILDQLTNLEIIDQISKSGN